MRSLAMFFTQFKLKIKIRRTRHLDSRARGKYHPRYRTLLSRPLSVRVLVRLVIKCALSQEEKRTSRSINLCSLHVDCIFQTRESLYAINENFAEEDQKFDKKYIIFNEQ